MDYNPANSNIVYNSNYRGYDIWEHFDTIIGVKTYIVYIKGIASSYESITSVKAAINCYILKQRSR